MRFYRYIGPKRIADRATPTPSGTPIRSAADVVRWIRDSDQRPKPDGSVIATFVVNEIGVLLIADRHSEHVACAGREPIRSAGEITFTVADRVAVSSVSNQSTGYCPEPESWPTVAAALASAGLESPSGFTLECIFRVCQHCSSRNLVKDAVFECGVCGADLPVTYNCQATEA